jgi:membrane-bound serine protease (ClpP class)
MKSPPLLAILALVGCSGAWAHAQAPAAQAPEAAPSAYTTQPAKTTTPAAPPATAEAALETKVALIKASGAINPAMAGYIARSIDEATAEKTQCLILQLDTPGGLLDSTKDIVQSFYLSAVPVVVYVAPTGANATSAGCFITLASDVAAMAPNTSIGAAHPVAIGGGSEEKTTEVMKQKLENFTASYIETIAQKRGRNAEWAKTAVRESANITAEKALATNVIEIIAKDLPDLLKQLDGRTVKQRVLRTANAAVQEIPMNLREQVFQMVWRPEVLMILMLIAMYGIIAEVSHPGGIIPGVVGVVALVLALYMSAALPINIAGITLMVLAVGLFIAEAFTPAFGLLTGGGVISLFFGLLLLFDRADPLFRLSLTFIIPATVVTAAFFLFIVTAGLRAQRLPVKVGRETLIGKTIPALTDITSASGKVFVEGEYWNAVCDAPIASGQSVRIVSMDGLTLKVKPKDG